MTQTQTMPSTFAMPDSNVWHLPRTMTTFNMHDSPRKVHLSNLYCDIQALAKRCVYLASDDFEQTQDLVNMMQDFKKKAEERATQGVIGNPISVPQKGAPCKKRLKSFYENSSNKKYQKKHQNTKRQKPSQSNAKTKSL